MDKMSENMMQIAMIAHDAKHANMSYGKYISINMIPALPKNPRGIPCIYCGEYFEPLGKEKICNKCKEPRCKACARKKKK